MIKEVSMFHEYDVIKLRKDMPAAGLAAGAIGAIVMVYTKDKVAHAYEVEFVNKDGTTQALLTLNEDEIEKAKEDFNSKLSDMVKENINE